MAKNIQPEADKRAAIYEEMTTALKKVADDFRVKESQAAKGNLLLRYDMGVKIKAVIEDEAAYGANAVEQLASFLDRQATDLYDLRSVVVKYDRDEVKALAEREMANGGHISMGHIMAIVRVKNAPDRKALWERVFAENLSVNTLSQEIAAQFEVANRRSGGRKPSRPTSAVAGIAQIVERTQELNNRFKVWDEAVFAKLPDLEPTKIDKIVLGKAEKASEELHKLEENLTQYVSKFDKGLKHVQQVMVAKDKEEKDAKAANKKEEKTLVEHKPAARGKKVVKKSRRPVAA